MKYGAVKNGKILYKFGFKQTQDDFPSGLEILPVEEPQGKGKVTFSIENGVIKGTVEEIERKVVKISNNSEFVLTAQDEILEKYLSKHFADKKQISWAGSLETTTWNFATSPWSETRKSMLAHVWARYGEWVKNEILSGFGVNEDNEPCGVSIEDLVLFSLLGNDYPVTLIGGEAPMSTSQINQSKVEFKQKIKAKRQEIKDAIKIKSQTAEAYKESIVAIAGYVMDGV